MDTDERARVSTANQLGIARSYADGHHMLQSENLDVLYSCVPAYARTDVEIAAAKQGVHLFSEKPQALDMAVARNIDAAIREAAVLRSRPFLTS